MIYIYIYIWYIYIYIIYIYKSCIYIYIYLFIYACINSIHLQVIFWCFSWWSFHHCQFSAPELVKPDCWWFRNPARKPPGMYKILWILGYLLHQLVKQISEPSTVPYRFRQNGAELPRRSLNVWRQFDGMSSWVAWLVLNPQKDCSFAHLFPLECGLHLAHLPFMTTRTTQIGKVSTF